MGRKLFNHLFISILFVSLCLSLNIETYNISFQRSVVANKRVVDSYSGDLFSNKELLFVDILSPVHQNFIVQDNKTILYYPDEKRGVSLSNNSFPVIPFYHTLLAFSLDDFGLSKNGYFLDSTVVDPSDKIITAYWSPPENLKKHILKTVLTIENDIIIKVESFNNIGNVFSTTMFSNFITLQNHIIPTKITFNEINVENNFVNEEIIFKKILINEPLPKNIVDFRLPDNVEIKEIEW